MAKQIITKVDEESLKRIAKIMGKTSAAAKALSDLTTRRQNNEDVAVYQKGQVYLVGPRIEEDPLP